MSNDASSVLHGSSCKVVGLSLAPKCSLMVNRGAKWARSSRAYFEAATLLTFKALTRMHNPSIVLVSALVQIDQNVLWNLISASPLEVWDSNYMC